VQLVGLVQSLDHVCCRYRLDAFRAALAEAGHSLRLRPLPRWWSWDRWSLIRELSGASVVVQRFLLPGWQLGLLRRTVKHLLFDFDDAIFLRDSFASKGLRHPARLRRFSATVRACDAVLAGNRFLADHACQWADPARVHLVPTCVDPARYTPHSLPGDGNELVWIGTSSTLQGLLSAGPILEAIGQAHPGLRLKVICDRFPSFRHLPVVARPWSQASEAHDLTSADIGISWLPDDDWSRGKCGLKILQYMAAGLPVITNPVGIHTELVRHGVTGYLASTPQEWLDAVARLRNNPRLRQRMGQEGRALFESRYTVGAGARAWLDVLARLEGAPAPVLREEVVP
jgi:glycosyltransferase involved in cell wall biosynthesis